MKDRAREFHRRMKGDGIMPYHDGAVADVTTPPLSVDYAELVEALETAADSGNEPARELAELRLTVTEVWSTLAHTLPHIRGSGRDGKFRQQMKEAVERLFPETLYAPPHSANRDGILAIATEARRAKTAKTGSAHEGAGGEAVSLKSNSPTASQPVSSPTPGDSE